MDFEAFGQSVDADMSKTPWPPTGPSAPSQTNGLSHQATTSGSMATNVDHFNGYTLNHSHRPGLTISAMDMGTLGSDFGWGQGTGVGIGVDEGNNGASDGFGWLSGIGAAGGFGTDGDLGFAQDSFW